MHIHQAFDRDLADLDQMISRLATLCKDRLGKALRALGEGNLSLARELVDGDGPLDALEVEIEAQVMRILALRQPMAVDLRVLLASYKIAGALERIGDHARNIGRLTDSIHQGSQPPSLHAVLNLGQAVAESLHLTVGALATRDVAAAGIVWLEDERIDRLYLAAQRAITACAEADPVRMNACTALHFVARHLERIGDLATNIAEMVAFAATGHKFPEDRPKGA